MITSIEIGYIRSFFKPQKLLLDVPNGERGSGYNVFVGKNNSGKSTIVKLIRDLISLPPTVAISQEARHDPNRPCLKLYWLTDNEEKRDVETLSIDSDQPGGLFKKVGGCGDAANFLRYVPSRRPFASGYNATSTMDARLYENSDFLNRKSTPAYFDQNLSTSLATLFLNDEKKRALIDLLTKMDPRITALAADNIGGNDVIMIKSASGRWHPISETGDGITNSIRIIYTLITASHNTTIVVDEPELSLHPQIQRNLYEILVEHSKDRQIVVVTHSPHFVTWMDLSSGGQLFRLFLDKDGQSIIRSPARSTITEIARLAQQNISSRKYFDTVCKELFFSDEAVLVEGPDDVHYISNYLSYTKSSSLPIMGYGCGGAGNIRSWMRLCLELGIRCASLFDGDKRDEYERSLVEFSNNLIDVNSFLLNRDDIRDKYERDPYGREIDKIAKKGVFRRNGIIHEDAQLSFSCLVQSVRDYLYR